MARYMIWIALFGLTLPGCSEQSPSPQTPVKSDASSEDPHAGMMPPHAMPDTVVGQPAGGTGGSVELGTMTLSAPDSWKRIPPTSSFVAAEFTLPHAEGDELDGRLTISSAGGSVEDNVARWKGQFDPLSDEKPTETIDVSGHSVTVVDLSGDFNDSRGPFAPAVKRTDYWMIAAVIPGDGQSYFIKATGPKNTMAAQSEAIQAFIRSIQPAK